MHHAACTLLEQRKKAWLSPDFSATCKSGARLYLWPDLYHAGPNIWPDLYCTSPTSSALVRPANAVVMLIPAMPVMMVILRL